MHPMATAEIVKSPKYNDWRFHDSAVIEHFLFENPFSYCTVTSLSYRSSRFRNESSDQLCRKDMDFS